ncbi:MAG: PAS domain-containing protein [Ignavibacteria bacterium]|nr:PAS domain-containing protein [Ignavibacteria bacterium]
MQHDREQKYKDEIAELKRKILILEDKCNEVLQNAEMAVVETRGDMRIINAEGAIDLIFEEAIDDFERGENLLKVIYKITHNTKATSKELPNSTEQGDSIEELINKFVEGTLEEKVIRIVGEKESGEIFLLTWKIKRLGKNFKSFFKVIPTNQIIKSAQDKHIEEINEMRKVVRDTLNIIEEGVFILNMKNEIEFMNNSAKRFFFSSNINLLKTAPIEGRLYNEIFINESVDEIKYRIEQNARCISMKKPVKFAVKSNDQQVVFTIFPNFNHRKEVIGTITIIKDDLPIFSANTPKDEIEKLSKALKYYSQIAKQSEARLVELENNQKWLMNKNTEYQSLIRSLSTFLDNIPAPIAILSLPSRKYEYVNNSFVQKFSIPKEQIKGKTDEDIFSSEDADIFDTKTIEAIETKEITKVSTPNFYAKQVVLVNSSNKPTNIIRIFL